MPKKRYTEEQVVAIVPDIKRMRTIEEENRRLKMKVAELTLDIDTVKELLRKNF